LNGYSNCLQDARAASSLLSLFQGGTVSAPYTRADVMAWDPTIDSTYNAEPNCNLVGYNETTPGMDCRFGLLANNESDCVSVDTGIGFGCARIAGSVHYDISAGSIYWNGEPGGSIQMRGWILVR